MEFQSHGRQKVEGAFAGGPISSDGDALLLRVTELRFQIMERFAQCFTDYRDPRRIEHSILELLRRRVYGIDTGYEDLNDHDGLMRDMLLSLAVGKLEVGKLDVDRSERYKKNVYHPERIETLLVVLFRGADGVVPGAWSPKRSI